VDDFLIARNPDSDSTLPYLAKLPLGDGLVLRVKDVWPRTSKLFCFAGNDPWPDEAEIVERVAVRSCVRRGAAIDLVLDRSRESRSMFVFAKARGRDVIFWQSARTARQARPNVSIPTSRASGQTLDIVVDSHEQYPWKFSHQQATTKRQALPAGDYAVLTDTGGVLASVERKSINDLAATLTSGKLRYVMAALSELPYAALVVEDRYSQIFKLTYIRPSVMAEGLAEMQVRFPSVPIVFAETRALAQEWTYRFLGAALAHHDQTIALDTLHLLRPTPPVRSAGEPTPAEIRAWAIATGLTVSPKGRLRAEVREAYATHLANTSP
jgi:ERCC4 domain